MNLASLQPEQTRWKLFASVNAVVFALLGVGVATHPDNMLTLGVYVQVLLLLCTLPLCWAASLRGPLALLVLMQAMLFVHFGLRDLIGLVFGTPLAPRPEGLFSPGELGALLSSICVLLGYAFVGALSPGRQARTLAQEWSSRATFWLGTFCWLLGFVITAYHLFSVADLQTGEVYTNPFAGVVALLRFLQPIGSALLVYLLVARGQRSVLPLLLVTFACDVLLGYLGDSKETAFRGMFLLLIGYVLLRDRVPVLRGLLLILLVGASFSYFAAYRDLLSGSQTTRVAAAERFGSIIGGIASEKSFAQRAVAGLDYFTERSSLKGNLELIIAQSGRSVPFQDGRTLVGVLYTFMPRYLFPDKPDTSTGRLFNAAFSVSDVSTTYISQGINGELYWNFGWTGLIVGMLLLGGLLAHANYLLDLSRRSNAPRYLFLIVTAYLLCVRFEGNVSGEYTYWLRALLLLWLVHKFMPKQLRSSADAASALPDAPAADSAGSAQSTRRPNFVALSHARVSQ